MTFSFAPLLDAFSQAHAATPALSAFCDLPPNPARQPITPHHIPAASLMESDPGQFTTKYAALRDAFVAAAPYAPWRETYKGTALGADFLDRFACFCLIGSGGPYTAPDMSAYVVYMPARLHYPFHHHPAKELYFILAGQAAFHLTGHPSKTLGPGEHVFHPANASHATTTHDHPVMALVLWRGDLATKPVLTNPEGRV